MQVHPTVVSVIVPACSHEDFIEDCLQSVVDQTFPLIEIIVIDDCSPDSTFARAKAFLEKHRARFKRVALRRNAVNRGVAASLNRGLLLAKGSHVSFLNSDDLYAPSRIDALLEALRSNNSAIAFSRSLPIDEDRRPSFKHALSHDLYMSPAIARARYPSLSWGMLWRNLAVSSGNMMLTRNLAARIGNFAAMRYCYDWDYLLRATFYCEPGYLDQDLYLYRIHDRNTIRTPPQEDGSEEMAEVARQHARRCCTARPLNELAAAPQYWPSLYQSLLYRTGKAQFIDAVYRPYAPYHRVVEGGERSSGMIQLESSVELRAQIEHLSATLREQLQTKERHDVELVKARGQLERLTKIGTEAKERVQELQQTLDIRSVALMQAHAELAAERARVSELNRLLAARSEAFAALEAQFAAVQAHNSQLMQQLQARDRALASIKASTAWWIAGVIHGSAQRFPRVARLAIVASRGACRVLRLHLVPHWWDRRKRRAELQLIKSSSLFDAAWYVEKYLDVRDTRTDPVWHYLKHGATEGQNPSPGFNSAWYLAQNPDVRASGANPLIHYLLYGATEGRAPHPRFDTVSQRGFERKRNP